MDVWSMILGGKRGDERTDLFFAPYFPEVEEEEACPVLFYVLFVQLSFSQTNFCDHVGIILGN